MEQLTEPWPQKSRTTEQRSHFGIDLDGMADIAGGGARLPRRPRASGAVGDLEQPLGRRETLPTGNIRLESPCQPSTIKVTSIS